MGLYENIKDIARIYQQADNINLYKQLLELSSQALEMQDEINRLISENKELKREKDIESKIIRHQNLYITLSDNTEIFYCTHCWYNEKKLFQVGTNIQKGTFICPHCKFEGIFDNKINKLYNRNRIKAKLGQI